MRHHAIIVTGFDRERVAKVRRKALRIFGSLPVSRVVDSPVNDYFSFFIGPDGSKEGWDESAAGDGKRAEFVDALEKDDYVDWAEVQYGDEDGKQRVLAGSRMEAA